MALREKAARVRVEKEKGSGDYLLKIRFFIRVGLKFLVTRRLQSLSSVATWKFLIRR